MHGAIKHVHTVATAFTFFALTLASTGLAETPEPSSATRHYDLDGKLGLRGYDAVAYLDRQAAVEGKKSINLEHNGVEYRFSSAANRDKFEQHPDQYRPAYGGWCAWAMASGGKTSPDPENFIVEDGRLFLFYKSFLVDTKEKWEENEPTALEHKADSAWAGVIGAGSD